MKAQSCPHCHPPYMVAVDLAEPATRDRERDGEVTLVQLKPLHNERGTTGTHEEEK